MIFYRSLRHPKGTARSVGSTRALALLVLIAYPAGALLRGFGPDLLVVQLVGWLLILASLVAFALLAVTRINRITGEALSELDEYERNLRAGALETGFQLFAGLVLLGILYLALASDFGWFLPTGYDQWNALFWGAFLYSSVLPTAILAVRLHGDDESAA